MERNGYADQCGCHLHRRRVLYPTNSNLFVTITRASGDFDGQLNQGDIIIGSFDLKARTMTIDLSLYGKKYAVKLTQK